MVDVAIVGAGPTGLYAAYYAGFRGLSVALVDALEQPGGQMAALYPEKQVYDVAGFPAVRAQDLVDSLVEQAAMAKPEYLLGHQATTLTETDQGVEITTSRGTVVAARAALITGGIGSFSPRPLPAAVGYENRGLKYFVPRPDELAGTDVVIVGGGDSAVDWALSLEPVARSVTLVHRRQQFRAHDYSVQLLHASSVRLCTPFEVRAVRGGRQIEEVEIAHARSGAGEVLKADSVVAALGFLSNIGPITQWGLALRGRHLLVDRFMRTNFRRVFAAGDIADYDGKIKLISVGFGEAALAINNLAPLVDSRLQAVPGHSSDALQRAGGGG
ncbi:NAD(P)/FAD-dependent oxidoreductase [Streptomyces sp. 2A115]|uniref:NAD(P)/FAD-dependent oxidoreductase n=1 Tax=Streptomyces sp. 2A115 TaxID=3457439 RepID=UPI003FD092DF